MEDPKPADFEFDALPGDKPAAGEPATDAPKEGKKRGPKKGSKRKARGPRRVAPQDPIAQVAAIVEDAPAPKRKQRKQHAGGKHSLDEYDLIGQMMLLSPTKRAHMLLVLNKVFG